ncbi:MAG: antitoxin Xre/MbcA/ParS toxin-binding domain-containing protein [Pseudomonadota bacterium]
MINPKCNQSKRLKPAGEGEKSTILGDDESGGEDAVAVWRAAIDLFAGNRAEAERWLSREAMGLGWKRPIDVMQEDPQQVLDLIGRIDHGVYT